MNSGESRLKRAAACPRQSAIDRDHKPIRQIVREAARDTGNVVIAQVKNNQPILHDTIETLCTTLPAADRAETVDCNKHGRQEHRLVETFDVSARLGPDGLIVTAARVCVA